MRSAIVSIVEIVSSMFRYSTLELLLSLTHRKHYHFGG
jgi:hypothetical protein